MQMKMAMTTSRTRRTMYHYIACTCSDSKLLSSCSTAQRTVHTSRRSKSTNTWIANHEVEEGEMERTLAAQQRYDATLKMVRESNAKAGIYRDASRIWPKPVPVRIPSEQHDWDFFYRW